jgi:hypothetical protein
VDDPAPPRIFVSYRRADTRDIAGRLRDGLVVRYGSANVVQDAESFEYGLDFVEEYERAISRSDVLLALIGPDWVRAPEDRPGYRDHVVAEIGFALERGVRVIPVLVNGATMPRGDQVPDVLEPFVRRHAVRIDSETFTNDVAPLLKVLDGAGRPPTTPIRPAPRPAVGWVVPAPDAPWSSRPPAPAPRDLPPVLRTAPVDGPPPPALSDEQVAARRRALTVLMAGFTAVLAAFVGLGVVGLSADPAQFAGWLPGHEFLAVRIVLVIVGSIVAVGLGCAMFFEIADGMWRRNRGPDAVTVPLGFEETPLSDVLGRGRSFALVVGGGVVGAAAGAVVGAALGVVEMPLYVVLIGYVGPFLVGYLGVAGIRRRYRAH